MRDNTTSDTAVLSRGVTDTIKMRIDDAAMAHVMSILTNLYADQAGAVVREYSTNARDSMVEAGREAFPIEVTLPTYEQPFLTIKDTGLGMDFETMRDVYSAYGTSTKRDSDLVQGMLGFGCKSGLTYASQFQVTAVKNGTKIQTLVAKDDEGVGSIDIMDSRPTTERNGVTVKIPVSALDFRKINDKVWSFFKFWEHGTVLVDGEVPPSFKDDISDMDVWLDDFTCVRLDRYERSHKVIMGNVAYPINLPDLLFQVSVTAWVNMGDVAFTPSREGLKDKERVTVETATELARYVNERLPKIIMERIEDMSTSPWDRYVLINKWADYLPRSYRQSFALTVPEGRQMWRLGGNYDVERRAERVQDHRTLTNLVNSPNTYLMLDYPHNNVSGSIKRRLSKLSPSGSHTQWYLIPEGTDGLSVLEGREHVFTFAQLPEADKLDRPDRTKREGSYRYVVVKADGSTYDTEEIKQTGDLYYGTPDKGRWSNTQHTFRTFVQAMGGEYVELTPRQVEKFLRNHPWAKEISATYHDLRQAAQAGITEADRESSAMHSSAQSHGFHVFESVIAEINDPDFTALIMAATTTYTSPSLDAAEKFGCYIGDPKTFPDDKIQKIIKRYPLLTFERFGRTLDNSKLTDAVLYVNAKFNTLP